MEEEAAMDVHYLHSVFVYSCAVFCRQKGKIRQC